MTPEQAGLLQQGSAIVALHLNGDREVQWIIENLAVPTAPNGLVYAAVVAEETWMLHTGAGRDETWSRLAPPAPYLPTGLIDRELVIAVARWLRDGIPLDGGERVSDLGVVFLSAFDLAVSAVALLAEATGVSGSEWCQRWALAAAAGEGVDPA